MAIKSDLRSRFGYFKASDIQDRIESGKMDAYDIVFTNDTNEAFIIDPELQPHPIQSRVYTFSSIAQATVKLNMNPDTYAGQIVAIMGETSYAGYIVNLNEETNKWVVTPVSEQGIVNYNSLSDIPMITLKGTLENTIVVSDLDDGAYSITGRHKITEDTEVLSSYTPMLYYITTKIIDGESVKQIKQISSTVIYNHDVKITSKEISSLKYITEDELAQSVDEGAKEVFDDNIDPALDERMERIGTDAIDDLFN